MDYFSKTYAEEVAAKMSALGRPRRRMIRRPNYVEYTLVTYEQDNKTVKKISKVMIDESKIFPSEEDFYWEQYEKKSEKRSA